jgi:CRP-like cAMP-binding protein
MTGSWSTNGDPIRNWVIRALSPSDRDDVGFETVSLASGDSISEPEDPVDWVYFPDTAVFSVITVMADGRTVESATVGCESVVGAMEAMAGASSVGRTVAQVAGSARRLSAARLRARADVSADLRRLLLLHSLANLAQAHQSVACNALHDVQQRLCRWLLMSQDRTGGAALGLTQQFIATMVGVQRTTITQALGGLTDAGFIRQRRGQIQIVDRVGMQARSCECYDAVQEHMERLIGRAIHA